MKGAAKGRGKSDGRIASLLGQLRVDCSPEEEEEEEEGDKIHGAPHDQGKRNGPERLKPLLMTSKGAPGAGGLGTRAGTVLGLGLVGSGTGIELEDDEGLEALLEAGRRHAAKQTEHLRGLRRARSAARRRGPAEPLSGRPASAAASAGRSSGRKSSGASASSEAKHSQGKGKGKLPKVFGGVTRAQVRSLVRLFDRMDRDGSGEVDIAETLTSGAFTVGASSMVAKSIFRALDKDKSETVSLNELLHVAFGSVSKEHRRDIIRYASRVRGEQREAREVMLEIARIPAPGRPRHD